METFPRYWPFVPETPVIDEFPSQSPLPRSFDVSLNLHLKNGWVNNREADDLRLHQADYDVTVMSYNVTPLHNELPIAHNSDKLPWHSEV